MRTVGVSLRGMWLLVFKFLFLGLQAFFPPFFYVSLVFLGFVLREIYVEDLDEKGTLMKYSLLGWWAFLVSLALAVCYTYAKYF
jgi:hypothetical protein